MVSGESGHSPCEGLGAVHRNVPPTATAPETSPAPLEASQTRYRLSGRHHTVTDRGNCRPHASAMSNRINQRDWRNRIVSSSPGYPQDGASLKRSNPTEEIHSGTHPSGDELTCRETSGQSVLELERRVRLWWAISLPPWSRRTGR